MRIKFDASYLFRLYSTERGHREVQHLASTSEAVVSDWHFKSLGVDFDVVTSASDPA